MLLIDPNIHFGQAFKRYMHKFPPVVKVAIVCKGEKAYKIAQSIKPRVCFVDFHFYKNNKWIQAFCKELKHSNPQTSVVLLPMYFDTISDSLSAAYPFIDAFISKQDFGAEVSAYLDKIKL